MTNSKAIYAGSFDPFTLGHLEIVKRGIEVFSEVVVLIGKSPTKTPLFSIEERKSMLTELFEAEDKVKVDTWEGLIIDYAKKNKATHLLRGLRPIGDFEKEFQMASMNKKLNDDVETIFFPTHPDYYYLSSSLVKEIASHKGDIEAFVPPLIHQRISEKGKS